MSELDASTRDILSRLLIEDLRDLVLLMNQQSVSETRNKMKYVMGELIFLGATRGEDILNQIEHIKICPGCQGSFIKWIDGKKHKRVCED
jgi:hypothetical protein